jgi:hypothetical protein
VTKIPKIINVLGGKVYFWLTISDVSVHGHLAQQLFWACGKVSIMHSGAKLFSWWLESKERKGPRSQYVFQGHTSNDLTSSK